MQPDRAGTYRDCLALLACSEEFHQLAGGGQPELVVELLGPVRVRLAVGGGDPVGQGLAGRVLELDTQRDLPSGCWTVMIAMVRNMCGRTSP
ncbi:hypothetical protein GCM10010306_103660 [Streptomyces umbrinus]|nr:hypothetical protein GCM10010306_103660 [Streptomyces umbrinus]